MTDLYRFRPRLLTLHDRLTPATLYISSSLHITTDTGPVGLSTGDTVSFTATSIPASGLIYGTNAFSSLAAAVTAASPNDTLVLGAETIAVETGIVVSKPLTLNHAFTSLNTPTVLQPLSSATIWLRVATGGSLNINNLTLDGTSTTRTIGQAIHFDSGSSGGTISLSTFQNISGISIVSQAPSVTVDGATFSNVGGGVQFSGSGSQTLSNSTYNGSGAGKVGEVAAAITPTIGATVVVSGNTIRNTSGGAVTITALAGANISVIGNALTGSGAGIAVSGSAGNVLAEYNSITGNSTGVISNGPAVDATNDWWGSSAGPVAPNNTVSGTSITTTPILNSGPPKVLFGTTPSNYLQAVSLTLGGGGGGSDQGGTETTFTDEFTDGRSSPVVFGAGAGAAPLVTYKLPTDSTTQPGFLAYDPGFTGGVNVAVARQSTTLPPTIATAPGAGGGPNIRLYNLDGTEKASFYAYDPTFRGGVYVALADVNDDSIPDIITGAGAGGGPNIRIYDGKTLDLISSFYAFDPSFRGGVRVTVANSVSGVTILAAAGPGGGPNVRGFTVQGSLLFSMMAYEASFTGGVYIATGDVNGDHIPDLVTGAGMGGGPRVRVFALNSIFTSIAIFGQSYTPLNPTIIQDFYAFDPSERTGVTVGVAESGLVSLGVAPKQGAPGSPNVYVPGAIIVGGGTTGAPRVRIISQVNGNSLFNGYVFDSTLKTGVSVSGLGIPPVPLSLNG